MNVLDAPSAVAVAKCVVARLWKPSFGELRPDAFHPRPCAWEDFTKDELLTMLDGFNTSGDAERRWFMALPGDEQARLVRACQYPEAA